MALIGEPVAAPTTLAGWTEVGVRVDHERLRAQLDWFSPEEGVRGLTWEAVVDLRSRAMLIGGVWWGSSDSDGDIWMPLLSPDRGIPADAGASPNLLLLWQVACRAAVVTLSGDGAQATPRPDHGQDQESDAWPVVPLTDRRAWAAQAGADGVPDPVPAWALPEVVAFVDRRAPAFHRADPTGTTPRPAGWPPA